MAARARRAAAAFGLVAALSLLGPVAARAAGTEDMVAACTATSGNPEVTIARCNEALEADDLSGPQRAEALRARGLAHFARRDLAGARSDLDAAVVADPEDAAAWNGRGIVALQSGDLEGATSGFDAALKLKPAFAAALANRGNAWLSRGDAARALADLDAAVALAPARPELALTLRGRARLAQGEAEGALADFDQALARNPAYSNALDGRGHALFVLGRFADAAAAFAQEWKQRPDPESAVSWIIAARRAGQPAQGPLAQLASPEHARDGLPAAVSLFAGRLQPEQVLQAATDRDPRVRQERQCVARFAVAEWLLAQGHAGEARGHLEAAAAACGAWQPEAADVRAELARLH